MLHFTAAKVEVGGGRGHCGAGRRWVGPGRAGAARPPAPRGTDSAGREVPQDGLSDRPPPRLPCLRSVTRRKAATTDPRMRLAQGNQRSPAAARVALGVERRTAFTCPTLPLRHYCFVLP